MAVWFAIEELMLCSKVGTDQNDKADQKRQRGNPDGSLLQGHTQRRQDQRAQEEHEDHQQVTQRPLARLPVVPMERGHRLHADLPDMVGDEGGSHGHTFCLAEGVVLHRGNEVDAHLHDLYRPARWGRP